MPSCYAQTEESHPLPAISLSANEKRRLDVLRAEVQKGIDSLEAGRGVRFTTADDMRQHLKRLIEEALASAMAAPPLR